MKLLLDENLPHQLRRELPGHDVQTAAYVGLGGVDNGALLRCAAVAGFDALITNDLGLEYQQNLNSLPLSVVVILASANTMEAIRPLVPVLLSVLSRLQPKEFAKVSIP